MPTEEQEPVVPRRKRLNPLLAKAFAPRGEINSVRVRPSAAPVFPIA